MLFVSRPIFLSFISLSPNRAGSSLSFVVAKQKKRRPPLVRPTFCICLSLLLLCRIRCQEAAISGNSASWGRRPPGKSGQPLAYILAFFIRVDAMRRQTLAFPFFLPARAGRSHAVCQSSPRACLMRCTEWISKHLISGRPKKILIIFSAGGRLSHFVRRRGSRGCSQDACFGGGVVSVWAGNHRRGTRARHCACQRPASVLVRRVVQVIIITIGIKCRPPR